jgi:hypothetical protein
MGSVAVVTSFSPQGYELYGKNAIETFAQFWPQDVKLYVYYEGEKPKDASPRAEWRSLDDDPERAAFMSAHTDHATDYNLMPVRFSHKVFALTAAPRDTDWLIWLDGDVETQAPVTHKFLDSIYPQDIVAAYMGRSWWNHTETGFVAYRLDDDGKQFLDDLRAMYTTGEVVNIVYRGKPQQHDCAAFDVLREEWEKLGHTFFDLGVDHKGPDLDVMAFTPLGMVMYHNKGNRKFKPSFVPLSRYNQLIKLVERCKPKSIVEVGTHRAARADTMCREALKHNQTLHYVGFDLFEEATAETNAEEMNGKGAGEFDTATRKLEAIQREHPGFTFELHKGNTRETLHGKTIVADFVFIDGGHSVETIRGDYEALKSSKLIAFDDHYTGIDTKKFGCNEVIKGRTYTILPIADWVRGGGRVRIAVVGNYPHKKWPKPPTERRKLSPQLQQQFEAIFDSIRQDTRKYADAVNSANTFEFFENHPSDKGADVVVAVNILEHILDVDAALAKIKKLAKKSVMFCIEMDEYRDADAWRQIVAAYFTIAHYFTEGNRLVLCAENHVIIPGVKTIASGTDDGRWKAILESVAKHDDAPLEGAAQHDGRAVLACYGPSLKDYIEKVRVEEGDLVSVSGSHDYLIENGLVPKYHVECDPRPHKAIHFTPHPDVTYLIASSCHPDVFKKLEGYKVRLWHAEEHVRVKDELNSKAPNILGGGSVGHRAIGVLYHLGYRAISLFGMDCSFEGDGSVQHAGRHAGKKQGTCICTIKFKDGDRHFVTSKVLMTYAASFIDMWNRMSDVSFRFYGDGLLQNWARFALQKKEAA